MRGLLRSRILVVEGTQVERTEFQIHIRNPFLAWYSFLPLLFLLGLLLASLQPSPFLLPFLRT